MVTTQSLGVKRTCPQCGARFYDLGKNPVGCPKCGAQFDTSTPQRTRRGTRERRVAELLDEQDDTLMPAAGKAKPASRMKPKVADSEQEELEAIGGIDEIDDEAIEEMEETDDIDDIEEIEDIESDDDEPLDDDITLEEGDIGDEALIDDVDEAIEIEEEDTEEESVKRPSGSAKGGKKKR